MGTTRMDLVKTSREGRKKERQQAINNLFDAVAFRTNMREYEVFRLAYGDEYDEKASKALCRFLLDVSTCPKLVEVFCERSLREEHEKELRKNTPP